MTEDTERATPESQRYPEYLQGSQQELSYPCPIPASDQSRREATTIPDTEGGFPRFSLILLGLDLDQGVRR